MRGQDFAGQDLRNRDFKAQDLRNCRFVGCDLREADFREAVLSRADFTDADLTDALLLGAVMHETCGAMRHGGPVVSIVGLPYPVLIDGRDISFKCETIKHAGKTELPRATLLRMDKSSAVHFHAVGAEILRWYKERVHAA